jgi:Uma2 family endonuclease
LGIEFRVRRCAVSPRAPLSFEEAARLDPDLDPGELDAGRWTPLSRATWRHGQVVGNAVFILSLYARSNPGWSIAAAGPGTKLGRRPDILRGPDVAIVRLERVPRGIAVEGWLEGAPDVAVEVVDDSQSHSALSKKALEYLAAGSKMVWVLDPGAEQLVVYAPPNQVRVLDAADALVPGEALPRFMCKVSEFFE